jgi:hypothetical protein
LLASLSDLHAVAVSCEVDETEATDLMKSIRQTLPHIGLITLCAGALNESLYPPCCVHLRSPYTKADLIKAVVLARWNAQSI